MKKVVASKVDEWVYEILSEVAEKRGETISNIVRELLEKKIKEEVMEVGKERLEKMKEAEKKREEEEFEKKMQRLEKWWLWKKIAEDLLKAFSMVGQEERDKIRKIHGKILLKIEEMEKEILKLEV